MSHAIQTTGDMITTMTARAGAAISVYAATYQDSAIAISGAVVAVLAVVGPAVVKVFRDVKAARRAEDIAEAKEWSDEIRKVQHQSSDEIRKVQRESVEFESKLILANARIAELEAKLKVLGGSQKEVVAAVNKARTTVKDVANRVGVVEQAMGSASSLELPTNQADDTPTSIDMPNIS